MLTAGGARWRGLFLMRRTGEAVSERTILGHVWGDDFEGDPNIVEVYVRRLRNRVDRPFGRDSLRTMRVSVGARRRVNGCA